MCKRSIRLWTPRNNKQTALVFGDGDDDCDVIANFVPRNRDMNAFSRANGVGIDAFFKCANCVSPNAGSIDNDMGANIELLAVAHN